MQVDNDLVLLHRRATAMVHLLTLSTCIRKQRDFMFTAERVIHTRSKKRASK